MLESIFLDFWKEEFNFMVPLAAFLFLIFVVGV